MAAGIKRGLVLGGGGAKGAYQFGCLKVFRKYRIHFDAVAGTSVGALNAAVWATGSMDKGANLWENLSEKQTYRCRRLGIFALLFITPSRLSVSFIDNSLTDIIPKLARCFSFAFSMLLVICWLPAVYSTIYQHTGSLFLALFIGIIAFIVLAVGPNMPWFRQLVVQLSFPLGLVWLNKAIRFSVQHHSLIVGGIPDVLMGGFAVFLVVVFLISKLPFSWRNPAPLKEKIDEILAGATLDIPTYVTVGVQREYTDPDDVNFYELKVYGSGVPPQLIQEAKRAYFPKYHLLNNVSQSEQKELLAASAALPFAIVPHIYYHGEEFVDGGVVDNVPVSPLIDYEQCDELVIVRLNADGEDGDVSNNYLKEWQRIRRLFKIKDIAPFKVDSINPPRSCKNDPPILVPFEQPSHWPKKFIVCKPTACLGGFKNGTLNFKSGYTQSLITKGENDAEELVRKYWPELIDTYSSDSDNQIDK